VGEKQGDQDKKSCICLLGILTFYTTTVRAAISSYTWKIST